MRAVIVGGAPISDYNEIKKYFKDGDFFVFCDSGLFHQKALSVTPHLIIGDFDSHPAPETHVETIVLPREKDDTDTVFAAKECLRRGFNEFLVVGAVGGRLDHSLVNLYLLLLLDKNGASGEIVDDFSEICLVDEKGRSIDKKYPYFSLVNIDGSAKGVTIEGAKYNLDNAEIFPHYQYATSNEVSGDEARVFVSCGRLLLIKVKNY